jgi:hypothetical protein
VRVWIISAVLAGLAATITGAVVNFSNTTVTEAKRILGIADSTVLQNGPVIATQVTQGFATCSGGAGWVFPQSASAAFLTSPAKGPTRGGQTWVSDPGAWGAVEASDIQVQLDVSTNSPHPIILTGIRADVIRRRPAIKGTVVNVEPPICAPPTFQIGTIDLDTAPPSWIYPGTPAARADDDDTTPIKFPYLVSESNPIPFVLTITTLHCDCTWNLEIDWSEGATFGKSIVTDNDQPFQTTASANLPTVTWSNGEYDPPWRICDNDNNCEG